MEERSRVLLATLLGAISGGVFGWLYLTRAGRSFRSQIEPKLDDFIREMHNIRATVEKARTAADEGWRSLNEVTGGTGGTGAHGRWSA